MPLPRNFPLAVLPWLMALATSSAWADNCDTIRAQIDGRMRAGGLSAFELLVVDASAPAPGRVVGTCGNGARRIVVRAAPGGGAPAAATPTLPASAPLAAARRPRATASAPREALITECLDGTMSVGGTCGH